VLSFSRGNQEQASQQEILNAGKATCIAAQGLVFASKGSRGKDPAYLKSLAKAAEGVSDSLGQLVRASQHALDELAKGTKDVEAAKGKVSESIAKFPKATEPNKDATPKRVVENAKNIIAASAGLSSAIATNNQDEMSRAANALTELTSTMLKDTVAIHEQLPQKPAVHEKMNNAVMATAKQVEELLACGAKLAVADEAAKQPLKVQMDKISAALAMTLHNIGDNIH